MRRYLARMSKMRGPLLAMAAILGTAVVAQDAPRSVRDRVYSPAQAAKGQELFESICANCHEIAEFTGGGAYFDDVDGKPMWETFEYISAEMPEDDPGSLNPEDYSAVLAYLLSIYGLPSGETALPVDQESLEAILITRPAPPGS